MPTEDINIPDIRLSTQSNRNSDHGNDRL